jgi:DNA polymerase III epsilon subunit-like protein
VKELVFIDAETTGIEPGAQAGEIVELALVAEDGSTLFHRKILPSHIETATQEALKINGYNADRWIDEGAVLFHQVAKEVFEIIDGKILVGQHVTFDIEFVKFEIRNACAWYPSTVGDLNVDQISYHTIDLASLIFFCLIPPLQKSSLHLACEYFGISNDGAHTALADARRARAVFFELMKMKPLLQWPGPAMEVNLGTPTTGVLDAQTQSNRLIRQFQKDYGGFKKQAKLLRKGDRFSYEGSFKVYEAQSDAVPDSGIEGKIILDVTDGKTRDHMSTRLDASLLCEIHGWAPPGVSLE